MHGFSDRGEKMVAWRLSWILSAAVAVALGGCEANPLASMKVYPVKGKVSLDDGTPLTSGRVVFVAMKSSLSMPATIESDGTFTVKGTIGDGLPEGDYRVRIEIDGSKLAQKGEPAKPKGVPPFPQKYADEDSSDLKATVTSDETRNHFEFKLMKSAHGSGGESQRRQR